MEYVTAVMKVFRERGLKLLRCINFLNKVCIK